MKYFTADLYAQYNSRELAAADRANTQWDKAEKRYTARLGRIRSRLPAKVRQLADKLCFHDAELISLGRSTAGAHLLLREGNLLHLLSYRLSQPLVVSKPHRSHAFSPNAVRWLYDEVDLLRSGNYCHGILLSDGRELRIVFDRFNHTEFEAQSLDSLRPSFAMVEQAATAVDAP
jgi:hypothetical protein